MSLFRGGLGSPLLAIIVGGGGSLLGIKLGGGLVGEGFGVTGIVTGFATAGVVRVKMGVRVGRRGAVGVVEDSGWAIRGVGFVGVVGRGFCLEVAWVLGDKAFSKNSSRWPMPDVTACVAVTSLSNSRDRFLPGYFGVAPRLVLTATMAVCSGLNELLSEVTAEAAVASVPSSLQRFWFWFLLVLFTGEPGDAGRAVPDGWSGLERSSGDLTVEDLFLLSLCESRGTCSIWFLSCVAPTPGFVGETGLM